LQVKLKLIFRTLSMCSFACSEMIENCHMFKLTSDACQFGQLLNATAYLPEDTIQGEIAYVNSNNVKRNATTGR